MRINNGVFRLSLFATATAALTAAPSLFAAPGDKLGPEFRVNTATFGAQGAPAMASSANGDFVVAWADYNPSTAGVYFRRYSANGVAKDTRAIPVAATNLPNGDAQTRVTPDVAMDDDGDFVVTWRDFVSYHYFNDNDRIVFRRYSASGLARDNNPREVTSGGSYRGLLPASVAMDADGNFGVIFNATVYDDGGGPCSNQYGLEIQRYSASGASLGNIEVSQESGTPEEPCTDTGVIAMESDGDFVIAFGFYTADYSYVSGTAVRRYHALGVPKDTSYIPITTDFYPNDVAVNDLGEFIVTSTTDTYHDVLYPDRSPKIMMHRYNSDGTPKSGAAQVNAAGSGFHGDSKIGLADDGSFTVAWRRTTSDETNSEIFWRGFRPDGTPKTSFHQGVNTFTTGFQDSPALAVNADGSFVVAWESQNQDGSGDGVYAQRFAGNPPSLPTVSFAQSGAAVDEAVGMVKVRVNLSAASTKPVTVPLTFAGTATLNADYKIPGSSLVIPAGAISANFNVKVINDKAKEPRETLTLSMGAPVNAKKGAITGYELAIKKSD